MPEEDKTELRTRDELLARIAVSMGGRAAEEVVLNTMTNGAAQDIQDATAVARNMVAMYGMSDRFGMMALASKRSQYLDGGYGMDCAQDTAAALDEAVRDILDQCYATAVEIIRESRAEMDQVVAYLLEKETITGAEMVAIIQGRDPATADSPPAGPGPRDPRRGGRVPGGSPVPAPSWGEDQGEAPPPVPEGDTEGVTRPGHPSKSRPRPGMTPGGAFLERRDAMRPIPPPGPRTADSADPRHVGRPFPSAPVCLSLQGLLPGDPVPEQGACGPGPALCPQ